MKIIKILLVVLFFGVLLFAFRSKAHAVTPTPAPYRKLCVGIKVTFNADSSWKGGPIEIGCGGDNGGAVNQDPNRWCMGQTQQLYPGHSYRLTKCSCFGSDKGCLRVGKKLTLLPPDSKGNRYIRVDQTIQETAAFQNNSCVAKLNGDTITGAGSDKLCRTNGQRTTGTIKISCKVPTGTPTHTGTPTPTGGICPKPDQVQHIKVTCPNCTSATSVVNTAPLQSFGTPTPTVISSGTGDIDEGNGCIRRKPLLEAVGPVNKTGNLGDPVQYNFKVTNEDATVCTPRGFTFTFDFDNNTSDKWFVQGNTPFTGYELNPGESSTGTFVQIQSLKDLVSGDSLSTAITAWYGVNNTAGKSDPVTIKYTIN